MGSRTSGWTGLLAGALCAGVGSGAQAFDTAAADRALRLAQQQLARTDALIPADQTPKATTGGSWTRVSYLDPTAWTQGFFPGELWYLYEATGDSTWRTKADARTRKLEVQKTNTQTHDLGFKFIPSFGHAYRLTGDVYYKNVLLTAAGSLASRYDPKVNAIHCCAWNPDWHLPVVIDTMMNLELLFWGAENGGQAAWKDMALNHALRTLRDLVRADGSTFHVADYDASTGALLSQSTFQGAANSSTWTRGQAWAIYGFTLSYRYTRDPRMLEAARRTADSYLSRLSEDAVPLWDFDAPPGRSDKDSSAAAATASALLELSTFVSEPARRQYRDAALQMLDALTSPAFLASGDAASPSLLLHGVGHHVAGQEVDVGLIYGDYYFLEALLRFKQQSSPPPRPQPPLEEEETPPLVGRPEEARGGCAAVPGLGAWGLLLWLFLPSRRRQYEVLGSAHAPASPGHRQRRRPGARHE